MSRTGSDVEAIEAVISRIEVVGDRWYQLTSEDDVVVYTSSQWSPSVDTDTDCQGERDNCESAVERESKALGVLL